MVTKPLWRPEADSIVRLTGKASVRAYYGGGRATRQTVSRPRGEMQAKLDAAAIRSPPG